MTDAAKLWIQALNFIAGEVDTVPFQTWFKDTYAEYDGESFVIVCPTAFAREWLSEKYCEVILSAVKQATGNDAVTLTIRA
ncbi:DnaA N-terminal domain-containing protein [Paenibacillus sp. GD4]|uniref:DnaA N-terminal domain-containing protein n=1 Tax=Paenibacillus sp. GD4 TaxID=3068890 RepID=UPI002796753F|nr:DnaA N-terminal domain-containing protein [Paenibacillus sp. GD4]MDQ1912314.1 DnaA N-terminal domain-containing protein [Paenibacillus sp. GD4]